MADQTARARGAVAREPDQADRREVAHAGLCARCVHLQVLRSKTSTFVRCAFSDVDPRFPRYPPLPVRSCAGFAEAEEEAAG